VDQQGHVYINGAHDIHRLSPDGTFRDIVLSEHYDKILICLFHKMLSSSNQFNQSIIIVINSLLIVLPKRAP
jgi:hypothetical protein